MEDEEEMDFQDMDSYALDREAAKVEADARRLGLAPKRSFTDFDAIVATGFFLLAAAVLCFLFEVLR